MEMESASPEKTVIEGVGPADANEESHLSEEAVNNQSSIQTPAPAEEANCDGMDKPEREDEEEGGMKTEEELSSINSMMSTVMNVGQINGVDSEPTKTSPRNATKSPSANRTGRRNQEVKDDRSSFICPLCNKNCMTQHQLTMHIRQHNTDSGGTDHSCSICGKALSSASSLDRHMLVHSGERPYKCVVCGQTFTTNGNMHRHMKIHEKDPSSIPTPSSSPLNKRRRLSKRKPSVEDEVEQAEEPPVKKVTLMQKLREDDSVKSEDEVLHCPICFKTFICKYDLETHMETHPDTTLRCNVCCITFRTHRGLLRHNSVIHKQLPTDPSGHPFIQNNPSIPLGFGDLAFIDFSCQKFPQIAQVWCESNLRRCSSKFHKFVCEVCNKAFPLQQSLDLHKSSHKSSTDTSTEPQEHNVDAVKDSPKVDSHSMDSKEVNELVPHVDTASLDGKNSFMECLGLQHSSLAKPDKSEEQVQQEVLDSIRFIHVEPPSTNLPQETSGGVGGFSILEPVSLQAVNKNAALSLLSLQPLHGVVSNGMFVPITNQGAVELADIEQILKIAASVPPPMSLSLLPKGLGGPLQVDAKQIATLKPKPLITPRSSMGASTPPPPVMNAQQASSGNISPSLPPQNGQQVRTAGQSPTSSSSSTSSSPTNWDGTQLGPDIMGNTIISYETGKRDEIDSKEKETRVVGKKMAKTEFPCRFCKEVFSFLGGLQAHMRQHLGASPYQCNNCSYAAPDKATLIRHLRTHSGERPYVCRICHYPFTVKANCERHLRKKHMKNTRKDIEKNIEYVSTSSSISSVIGGNTLDLLDTAVAGNTSCRYCGEDLKNYRALQIHLRTHNGCQRKPFECRQCGAAFLAKRNCILHLLKHHPDVPEREIEEHIKSLVPVVGDNNSQGNPQISNGLVNNPVSQNIGPFTGPVEDQDQPLDFSSKSQKTVASNVKVEASTSLLINDCSMEPIDLSIPKDPEKKRMKKEVPLRMSLNNQDVKKEQTPETTPGLLAALPVSISSLASALSNDLTKPFTRLKPLRPKPSAVSNISEMPPLASLAQIISSVSATPVLIETGMDSKNDVSAVDFNKLVEKKGHLGTAKLDSIQNGSPENSKRGKKRPFQEEMCDPRVAEGSGIDLESSGEFPSVEKMLATTDANKFSPYLQPSQMEPMKEEKVKQPVSEEVKEGREDKPKKPPQNKGKKNAYSNSVQKMTCPYCPRLFPWASSLQRHMLTHTGQKPYPCPQCDSFFSTKSNCERHLLRKHGISNRALQNSGSRSKSKADEESRGSTESICDTELPVGEDIVDLSSVNLKQEDNASSPEQAPEQTGQSATEQTDSGTEESQTQPAEGSLKQEENDDEDSQSNKSLDMNLASKLVGFKLSGAEQHQPKSIPDSIPPSDEFPHTCVTCKKTFRHAATLSRHQKTHLQEIQPEDGGKKGKRQPVPQNPITAARNEVEQETKLEDDEKDENSSCAESGDDEEEKEDLSDEEEESASSELRALEEDGESTTGKNDKRKKICEVCSKRFWSLQDLTRHMRSHTGERPYKCQTCHRTFTLKHSLVRHQRVHQKPTDEAEMNEEMERAKDDGGVLDEKETRCSSGSESEASAPLQSENELQKKPQEEESEGHMEEFKENQQLEDSSTEMNSAEEPPKEPQLDEAEQEEHQTEESPVASAEAQSGCDPEPAEISVPNCTAAQETTEMPVE